MVDRPGWWSWWRRTTTARGLTAALMFLLVLGACAGTNPREMSATTARPVVVVGLDGAAPQVIDALWQDGKLPAMRALADRGLYTELKTDFAKSPLIWTTIATGVEPKIHGIQDFVLQGPAGLLPVSSTMRQVPALWNMTSTLGLRTAVLGWWATWPVEQIEGVMVSDRVTREVADRVWPPAELARINGYVQKARQHEGLFRRDSEIGVQDQAVAWAAHDLVDEAFDLMLVYLRSVDTESHQYWHTWEPEAFEDIDPADLAAHRHRIPQAYEAVDAALADLVAAAPPETNFFVLSDHGFHAGAKRRKLRVATNRILAALGYLTLGKKNQVDIETARAYSYRSAAWRHFLRVPIAEEASDGERQQLLAEVQKQLAADLRRVKYVGGDPVLTVREPRPKEARDGADLMLEIETRRYTREIVIDGIRHSGWVTERGFVSGSHSVDTHGILIAAGPDIHADAELPEISIRDMAPTLLMALGLPVARDFSGQPCRELFTGDFRRRQPLRTVASWGTRDASEALASEADAELVEELRALGYLN